MWSSRRLRVASGSHPRPACSRYDHVARLGAGASASSAPLRLAEEAFQPERWAAVLLNDNGPLHVWIEFAEVPGGAR